MINFLRFFGEPEFREDKLKRMWTRISEADQRRRLEEEIHALHKLNGSLQIITLFP